MDDTKNEDLQEYLSSLSCQIKQHSNYLGICKRDFPKWEGWAIISRYKTHGVKVQDVEDQTLDYLVMNHYYLEFIKYMYRHE